DQPPNAHGRLSGPAEAAIPRERKAPREPPSGRAPLRPPQRALAPGRGPTPPLLQPRGQGVWVLHLSPRVLQRLERGCPGREGHPGNRRVYAGNRLRTPAPRAGVATPRGQGAVLRWWHGEPHAGGTVPRPVSETGQGLRPERGGNYPGRGAGLLRGAQ